MRLATLLLTSSLFSQSPGAATTMPLAPRQAVDLAMATGQPHVFLLELPADHYARVSVTATAGTIEGVLNAPDGSVAVAASSRSFAVGNIPFSILTDTTATVTLRLSCGTAAGCRYSARFDELRPRDDEAVLQLRGERAIVDGEAARLGRGDPRAAAQFYANAAAAFQPTRDRSGYAVAMVMQAQVLRQLDDLPQALALYDRALEVYRTDGDRRSEARTLRAVGDVQRMQGDVEASIESITAALAVAREFNDRPGEGVARFSLGTVYDGLGEWQQALAHKQAALEIWRAENNRTEEALVVASLAVTFNRMGDSGAAVRHITDALEMMKAAPESEQRAHLNNAGVIHATAGDFDAALRYYDRALGISQRLKLPQAGMLNNIGYATFAKGDAVTALTYYQQALPLFRSARDQVGEAACLRNIARARASGGSGLDAIGLLEESLAISRRLRDRRNETLTLFQLAVVERDAGQLERAGGHVEEALNIAETLRSALLNQSLRTAFLASVHRLYEVAIDIRMRRHAADPDGGHAAEAFALSERAKARGLIELLAESDADLRSGVDAALIHRERSLQRQITAQSDRLLNLLTARSPTARVEEAERRLASASEALADVQSRIRAASPRYAGLTQPAAVTAVSIQREILDSATTLIAFALGEARSYAFVISQDGFDAVTLPSGGEIDAAARRLYDRIGVPSSSGGEAAATLGRMVLDPLRGRLPGRRIAISADGGLHYVPFAALLPGHEIVAVPSASAVRALRRDSPARSTRPRIAVFADPVFSSNDPRTGPAPPPARQDPRFGRLIGSRREARAIAALASPGAVRTWLGFDASRDAVLNDDLRGFSLVHFATHGIWDSERPDLSGLALSMVDAHGKPLNGFLRLNDVLQMKLRADLVTLSACQTALGKDIKGEGLVGITRGFMHAGARRVLATLWKVDDAATAALMEAFYSRLLAAEPLPAAAALREAQAVVRAQPRWRAPHYWAGYVLHGDWQ